MKKKKLLMNIWLCMALCACNNQSDREAVETVCPPDSPQAALQTLVDGNNRYISGTCIHPNSDQTRRTETSPHQNPYAAIVSCSDSRVPVELIFDQGIGDLFVIRSAGNNTSGKMIMGSIEYAVEHLGVKVLMVLGHESCGGVTSAISHGEHHGVIGELLHEISKDIPEYIGKENLLNDAIQRHTKVQVEKILQNPVVAEKVAQGGLIVKDAYYDIDSGKVQIQ